MLQYYPFVYFEYPWKVVSGTSSIHVNFKFFIINISITTEKV